MPRNERVCASCGASLVLSCDEAHPEYGQYCTEPHRRPEPTWVDVRAAALRFGWTRRPQRRELSAHVGPVDAVWGDHSPGYLNDRAGWARFERKYGKMLVTVVGPVPDRGPREYVGLVDPSPARVLLAARLIGLNIDQK